MCNISKIIFNFDPHRQTEMMKKHDGKNYNSNGDKVD